MTAAATTEIAGLTPDLGAAAFIVQGSYRRGTRIRPALQVVLADGAPFSGHAYDYDLVGRR